MSGWQEQATALSKPDRARQSAFATKVIDEVLAPGLREFSRLVIGTPGILVFHDYHGEAFCLTCDLGSRRFSVRVFLLPNSRVWIAVSLAPSRVAGWHSAFVLDTANEAIEEWFGTALARLYETA